MRLAAATEVGDIVASLENGEAPALLVVDSIQTMFLETLDSSPGTVSQVRTSAQALIRLAKARGTALVLVGHVTKEGLIAGPRVLEHMVDTVLYFEGERGHHFRILRAVKNRFGPTDEIGVFEMTDAGLKEVANPSALFLSGRETASTAVADELFDTLRARFADIAVVQWDERLTTLEAQKSLTQAGIKARDHRARVDSAAAVIMLQNYIDAIASS